MCYSMFEKRSGAAKKSIDSSVMTHKEADKPTAAGKDMTAAPHADDKAYSGFLGRIKNWVAKDEQKEKESAA